MKVKLFEDFTKSVKWKWALSDEMKSKINDEINNVLIELVDNGFEIEIDYFAKKIAEQNSILVSIHKVTNNEVFNTDEVKDNIEVLLDYMEENYGIVSYDYGVEVLGVVPIATMNGFNMVDSKFYKENYPDNLDVIEIDIDITI
jgi:hypothetical protein